MCRFYHKEFSIFSNLRAFIFILEESCNRWNLKGLLQEKKKVTWFLLNRNNKNIYSVGFSNVETFMNS